MKKCLDDMVRTSAITYERDDCVINSAEGKDGNCQNFFYDFKFGLSNSWVEIAEPVNLLDIRKRTKQIELQHPS